MSYDGAFGPGGAPGGGLPAGDTIGNRMVWDGGAWVLGPQVDPSMIWADVIAEVNAWAGILPVEFLPGTYIVDAPFSLDSGAMIEGSPGVRLISTMPFTGLQDNNVFMAQAVASGKTGTLNGAAVVGSNTLSYTLVAGAAPAVGEILALSSGLSEQVFRIAAVAGVGPYTLTLDHPIVPPFPNAAPMSILSSRPTGIRIRGNGMTVSGTGDRVVEIVTGYQCLVDDVHYDTVDGAIGDIAFAYDIGGQECTFSNCSADGLGAAGTFYGFALEACERSHVTGCVVTRSPNVGIAVIDSLYCGVVDCACAGQPAHFSSGALGFGTGGALGCFGCYAEGVECSGGVFGLVFGLADRTRITDCSFNYFTNTGIMFNAAGIDNTFIEQTNAIGCGRAFQGGAGNAGTRLTHVNFSAATIFVMSTASPLKVESMTCEGLSAVMGPAIAVTGATTIVRIRDLIYQHSGISNAIQVTSNARVEIDNSSINLGATSIGLYSAAGGGLIVARAVRITGGAASFGASITAATLRHKDCDFSLTTTPIALGAGGYQSIGAFPLTGAVPVVIPWPDLKSTDHVDIVRQAFGGVPALDPILVKTPGTGFAVTGVAGDTSTFEYYVH